MGSHNKALHYERQQREDEQANHVWMRLVLHLQSSGQSSTLFFSSISDQLFNFEFTP